MWSVNADLGVFTVLTDVVIKRLSPGRECGNDEVVFVWTAIGEHDGGLIVAAKEIKHVSRQRVVKVGAPNRAMVFGVLDDGTRVANQGGVDPKLPRDGQCALDRAGRCRGPAVFRLPRRERPPPPSSAVMFRPDPVACRPHQAPGFDSARLP